VFGRRSALAALGSPAVPADPGPPPAPGPSPVPPRPTREALWRHAGLQRSPDELKGLQDDPFPLARMIAACALAREESRGAHQRIDHPETDASLDLHHAVVAGGAAVPAFEVWR
jgi:L-aspartate oxidase